MADLFLVRLPDGRMVRPEEWTPGPLYSEVELGSGAISPLDAFSYALGGNVPGSVNNRIATLQNTNAVGQGGILQEQQELMIFSIAVSVYQRVASTVNFFNGNEAFVPDPPHMSVTNMLRCQLDTLLRLKIAATKDYIVELLGFFPPSCGVEATLGSARSAGSAGVASIAIGANGSPNENTHRRLATPQTVHAGEAFIIRFEFPWGQVRNLNFGADDSARIVYRTYTRGLRRRPLS